MAGVVETLEISHLERYGESLDLDGLDYTKPLRSCALACRASILGNFSGAHAPDGTAWAALAFPRPRGGDKPLNDTGLLRASSTAKGNATHVEDITSYRLDFGTVDERAGVHQYGAIITPQRAKFLAIPKTRVAQRTGSPRDFGGTLFFVPSKSGGVLAERKGKGKKATLNVHYVLVDKVTIPARPSIGWSEQLVTTCETIICDFAAEYHR